jgi:alkylation response protein AidB-like acyl-CoA dehydrogenase
MNFPDNSWWRELKAVAAIDVPAHLGTVDGERTYPTDILNRLASLGLFGMNVPREYGGLGARSDDITRMTELLSEGWMCLPSVIGSHMRAAPYILAVGTQQQKELLLPVLARAEKIWAHGYSERRLGETGLLQTRLTKVSDGEWSLSGTKNWVTNALHADTILVVANNPEGEPVAVMVDPSRTGVERTDLGRPGMLGASLCQMTLTEYRVGLSDLVGGPTASVRDVLAGSAAPKALAFAARAVGSARAVQRECRRLMELRHREVNRELHSVAMKRWGENTVDFQAAQSFYLAARAGEADPLGAKIFCSEALLRITQNCMVLLGGDGYASSPNILSRVYRDALSLTLAGSSNDVLLTRLASRNLEE